MGGRIWAVAGMEGVSRIEIVLRIERGNDSLESVGGSLVMESTINQN
jgi:hypothetical protein